MALTNYHCHSDFCDGTERPRAHVEAALYRGMSALGISSHAPLTFPTNWCIGRGVWPSTLGRYASEIDALKRLYRGRIGIWSGLEVDYIPGLIGPADEAFSLFDYRIGSVHFVGRTREGRPWQMDDSPETFERGLEELFEGDIRALAKAYYTRLAEMALNQRPDIVGHFDLIKKYNAKSRYFREDEAWYRDLVDSALVAVARSGCILELNTGGMARGWTEEPYPGLSTLMRCRELGIPVTLDSDSHSPQDLVFGFGEAAAAFLRAGYRERMVLGRGGWQARPFDQRGLPSPSMKSAA